MTTSLASLLVQQTKTQIYEYALSIATDLGLPVTSWQAGDPTRSLYHLESELLATLETVVVGFISSGFLDFATGTWLKIRAEQNYGVTVPGATFASTDVVVTNTTGAVYEFEANDLTFKSTTSGKTYRNTTGGTLAALGTLTVSVAAEEAGSDSSAGAGEIDDFVVAPVGLTCTNPLAAVGIDEQSEATTRQQCRDKLGALSPNGPKEAYSYVARNSELTGTSAVTRVRVYSDSATGDVTVYLAGPSGGVAEPDRALVEDAIATWATPLCITATVLAASNVPAAVTYSLWIYRSCNKTTAEVELAVQNALEDLFAGRPIGGDIITSPPGALYLSMIESAIRATFPQVFRVTLSLPAADVSLTAGQVATLGTVTPTVTFVNDP